MSKIKNRKYTIKEFDGKSEVLISKDLLYFALGHIQRSFLLSERYNYDILAEDFTEEEINKYIENLEADNYASGYYSILELINGEKFND